MMLFRPIQESDLENLIQLSKEAGTGFTTLPNDENYLQNKIEDSLRAFEKKVRKPGGETYLFVLEDTDNKKIVGTSGLISKVGGFTPFYTYKITKEHIADKNLNVSRDMQVLHLMVNHDGPSEASSLYLSPKQRKSGNGRLLSLGRFLFMAEFPQRFEKDIISELRGVSDKNGVSPFWECVGRHFFHTDFAKADFLSGLGNKEFIKNLMPKYPIYIPMLPHAVQEVIGKVHEDTKPALHLLLKEGFKYNDEVDIFDAGPTVSAQVSNIRTIRQSHKAVISADTIQESSRSEYLISNAKLEFRACLGEIQINKDKTVSVSQKVINQLQLKKGDSIRFAKIHST